MKGDRIEALVDTGQGVQTFEISATRAGRRVEVTTSRGVVEVREVTRSGQTVRTGRFMTSRLVALVEHPAADERGRVEITTGTGSSRATDRPSKRLTAIRRPATNRDASPRCSSGSTTW